MKNYIKHNTQALFLMVGFLYLSSTAFAQDQQIGTESVTVVKTYAPIILVGAKPILAPSLSALRLPEKITLNYHLIKFPVATSFTPELGAAKALEVEKPPKEFNSLVYVGLGMRATAELLYDSRLPLSKVETIGLGLEHSSMTNNLPNLNLDSNFFKTQLKLSYLFNKRGTRVETDLVLMHLAYSWYGLDFGAISPLELPYNLQQGYFSAAASGKLSKEKGSFKNVTLSMGHFRDLTKSSEVTAHLYSDWQFPLGEVPLDIKLEGQYVAGDFKYNSVASFESLPGASYAFYKTQMSPKISWTGHEAFYKMGAQLVYANPIYKEAGHFKIYPDLYAHSALINKQLIAFGSLTGGFALNSFEGFVNENPFVSPSLTINPTDIRHHLRLGLKGLLNHFSYELFWAQQSIENRALFVENPTNFFKNTVKTFNYGNSFEVVYEAMKQNTMGLSLAWEPIGNLQLRVDYEKNTFNLTNEPAAWHLPKETAHVSLDYSFLNKFKLNANFSYVGQRAARESQVVQFIVAGELPTYMYELPAYKLLDMTIEFQLNQRLSIYGKARNLTDSNYEVWSGFTAAPRILMLGASYQFNL